MLRNIEWTKASEGSIIKLEGSVIEQEKRITDVVWAEMLSPLGCVMQSYINAANSMAGWNYAIDGLEPVQIARYKERGHYGEHIDTGVPVNNRQRKLSCALLLNDPKEYEGGVLQINEADNKTPICSVGSIVVFPSFVKHEVTPVTKGVRYSAVMWATGPTFR